MLEEKLKKLKKLIQEFRNNTEIFNMPGEKDGCVKTKDVKFFLDDLEYELDEGIYKAKSVMVNYIVATQDNWHYLDTEEEANALKEELMQKNIESIVMKDVKILSYED